MNVAPRGEFNYDPDHDAKDGQEWLPADIEELVLVLMNGGSVEQAATLLCRSGTVEDVKAKAKRLGFVG